MMTGLGAGAIARRDAGCDKIWRESWGLAGGFGGMGGNEEGAGSARDEDVARRKRGTVM